MPLVYSEPDIIYKEDTWSRKDRFHWKKLRAEVAKDVDFAKNAKVN